MNTFSALLGIAFIPGFFSCILFVIFGQVTARKLRKNPEVSRHLGMEFMSGWNILNIAQALATPQRAHKMLENSPVSFLHANSELLKKHTNKLDRILAILFFWPLMISGLSMALLALLKSIGLFAN
ncbi:hypothetical protein [Microbulbifer agarilyticus]|uniref:hypothetical protein n=1 Tax=Microbulbifer agarilyticus TaxID=260552 RepID=UPI001CD1E536|nr:hypothetical protein [Microbulbifer agarilyticus]MCA0901992.1 hypothetical protein [Microbulbifer agarilyticus]